MRQRIKAFTAVEVTMVAAVIAILALIILPLFHKRAEKAKITASLDDLQGLAKAEILANADTGWYFRLQDLDNTKVYDESYTSPAEDPLIDESVPWAIWSRALFTSERETLANTWEGPYIALQTRSQGRSYARAIELGDFRTSTDFPQYTTQNAQGFYPILVFNYDSDEDKIPVDPWGAPYLFFAPETLYGHGVIYSMGPNVLPGDGSAGAISINQLVRDTREPENLGNGDDLKYVF